MVRLFTQFQNALLQMEYSKKNKESKWHMLYVYGNIIRIVTDAILNDNLGISIFNKIYCKCLQRNHVHWASLIKSTDAKLKIFKMRYKLKTGNFWVGSTWLIILARNAADYTWLKLPGKVVLRKCLIQQSRKWQLIDDQKYQLWVHGSTTCLGHHGAQHGR